MLGKIVFLFSVVLSIVFADESSFSEADITKHSSRANDCYTVIVDGDVSKVYDATDFTVFFDALSDDDKKAIPYNVICGGLSLNGDVLSSPQSNLVKYIGKIDPDRSNAFPYVFGSLVIVILASAGILSLVVLAPKPPADPEFNTEL